MAFTKEQLEAITKRGRNIIVSAGAGSGKTAVLTERVLTYLKNGTFINELLILTFTNAAAKEMKERIRNKIQKESLNDKNIAKNLDLLDEAYITTFDSFSLSIVKKYHYLLNINKDIKITNASIIDTLKRQFMDEIFLDLYDNKNEDFLNFIKDFCIKDDKSILECLLKIADAISIIPNTEDYLNNYISNYFNESFINMILEDYLNILLKKQEEINQISYLLSKDNEDISNSLNEILGIFFSAKSINEITDTIKLVKLPVFKDLTEEEKELKSDLDVKIKKLKETTLLYGKSDEIIKNIKETKKYVLVIIEIIKRYFKKLEKYKLENSIYDFSSIAKLAIKVLKENENIRENIRNSLKEIMIDEYQDTSDLQEEFINLISNNNVYMVGDIKQSIYRFRNANPLIFKNKYENFGICNNGYKIDLVKNFRSRKEVLNNINEIFNLVMDDYLGGADYKNAHQMVFGNTTYINEGLTNNNYNMNILEYDSCDNYTNSELEAFIIAKDIKKKIESKYKVFDKDSKVLRDITYSDFVILMDRTGDFSLYKKIFEYLKIPLELYQDEKLNNNDNIFIIKNIIDFIICIYNKDYDISFKYDYVSIARSYLFNLSDQEIFNVISNNVICDTDIYKLFENIANNINNKSIKSIIEEIIKATKMKEKLITIGNLDENLININKILEIADSYNSIGYNIFSFNNFLKNLIDNEFDIRYSIKNKDINAVKIMTIHKSKGLEYHICYYAGLYKHFNINDLKSRFLIDNKYGIITPVFNDGIKDTVLKYLMKNKYNEEEISEKIRLFYVALTRCKEQMIIIVPNSDKCNIERIKYKSFADILNSIKKYLIKYYKKIDLSTISLSKDYVYMDKSSILNSDDSKLFKVEEINCLKEEIKEPVLSKNSHKLIDKNIRSKMDFGTKIHEYLEYLDFENPDFNDIPDNFIREKLKNFMNLDIIKNNRKAKIYHEYEFIYSNENEIVHGIIDLLIENDKDIFIIDYKLKDTSDLEYKRQLNGYRKYIKSISDKKIFVYLYSILNESLEEIGE